MGGSNSCVKKNCCDSKKKNNAGSNDISDSDVMGAISCWAGGGGSPNPNGSCAVQHSSVKYECPLPPL